MPLFAGHALVSDSLASVLDHGALPEESLLLLQQELSQPDTQRQFITAMLGERAMSYSTMEDVFAGNLSDQDLPPFLRQLKNLQQSNATKELLLLREKRLLLAHFLPYLDAPLPAWPELLNPLEEQPSTIFPTEVGILLPALDRAATAFARCEAGLLSARAALAIERYRSAHGQLPDTLETLVPEYLPEVPTDPFDGQAIRYRTLNPGYVVYSVFNNRVDDGGEVVRENGKIIQDKGDWAFRVLR